MLNLATSFTQGQKNKLFTRNQFKTIYWYGERYYCAAEVDAHMNDCCDLNKTKSIMDENENMESGSVSATDYWLAIANEGTLALSSSTQSSKPMVARFEPADSPHSVTSSTSAGCGGASSRGRAIGKRNQEFYLPDGGVRLSHVSTGCDVGKGEAWFGRYDKQSNTIIRTLDADTDIAIAVYETLAHFAQEHDRDVHHSDPKDTPNVWKNHLFTFFNTVTCEWEPLSNLRE